MTRHWEIVFDPEYASPIGVTCDCDIGRDHLYDGTLVEKD